MTWTYPRTIASMSSDEGMKEQCAFFMKILDSLDYVAYRQRNPEREPGTCQWTSRHAQFRSRTDTAGFSILRISGDPGCGKSVAASYLVSYLEGTQPSALTAYFFFKDDSDKQSKKKKKSHRSLGQNGATSGTQKRERRCCQAPAPVRAGC